jgi:two-component system sensor histidine kinase ResE
LIEDEDIPLALEQVDRMDTLTRSLLDLSQVEGIPSEIQRQDIDLADLLRDLDKIYASRSEQAELKFKMEVDNDPTFILGNAAQAETLIRNLLDNAIKFTPSGGQVNVKLSSSDEGVQLNVSDTGIGIPEDDLSHLFSRFHRGRNASPYPGSGLGLAIVKAITDQHQATIDVERKSPGTEFVVRFIPYRSS